MRLADFDVLPGDARIWIFGAERELTPEEEASVFDAVDAFLDGWNAHGTPLDGARSWRHGRFLIVGVDESSAPPSGCSIDALIRVLKGLESETGVRFLGNEAVWFRVDGEIERASRPEFRQLVRTGAIGADVTVFDNSITRLSELRENRWEGPAQDRWHGPAFFGG